MKANPARTYRQLSAQGASPVGVVVQAYDQIVSALGGAIRAMGDRNIEEKTRELNHALALISTFSGTWTSRRREKSRVSWIAFTPWLAPRSWRQAQGFRRKFYSK